jgi:hypothetical protein
MCGPKFCSIRISHDIRAEAQKEGMAATPDVRPGSIDAGSR